MDINRRNFLKVIGVMGCTFTAGKSLGETADTGGDPVEFNAILYDSTLCAGCQSCEFACADKYNLPQPEDYPEAGRVRQTDARSRVVINEYDTSEGLQYIRNSCNHCNDPACASACPTKAMYKTEEGPVIWHSNKCMGCRSCMISCPFDVPKFDYDSPNPIIQKCRMCYEFTKEGETPACVSECPAEALIFGKRRELIEIARKRIYAEPEKYNHNIYGEHEVGGTGILYISSVPFEELGFRNDLGKESYPKLNRTFLYSVPAVLILWPAFMLGLYNSYKQRIENAKKGGPSWN